MRFTYNFFFHHIVNLLQREETEETFHAKFLIFYLDTKMTDVIFMSAESRTNESRTKDDENVIFMNDKNQTNSSVSTKEDDDEVEMYDPARDEDNDSWIEM